jgi:hypothetical protein
MYPVLSELTMRWRSTMVVPGFSTMTRTRPSLSSTRAVSPAREWRLAFVLALQMIECPWPPYQIISSLCVSMTVETPFGSGLWTVLHLPVLADVRTPLADQQFDSETVDVGRVSCH